MAKLDELKEEIGWLKIMFGIIVVNKKAYIKMKEMRDL